MSNLTVDRFCSVVSPYIRIARTDESLYRAVTGEGEIFYVFTVPGDENMLEIDISIAARLTSLRCRAYIVWTFVHELWYIDARHLRGAVFWRGDTDILRTCVVSVRKVRPAKYIKL